MPLPGPDAGPRVETHGPRLQVVCLAASGDVFALSDNQNLYLATGAVSCACHSRAWVPAVAFASTSPHEHRALHLGASILTIGRSQSSKCTLVAPSHTPTSAVRHEASRDAPVTWPGRFITAALCSRCRVDAVMKIDESVVMQP